MHASAKSVDAWTSYRLSNRAYTAVSRGFHAIAGQASPSTSTTEGPRRSPQAVQPARMHRSHQVTPALQALLHRQDGVVTSQQLLEHGFSPDSIQRRVRSGVWQRRLPGVVATVSGELSRRQLLISAQLWGGDRSAIDGPDACAWHGLKLDFAVERVHLVVPAESGARSQAFVSVRRAMADIRCETTDRLRYVDAATAVIVAARGLTSERAAIHLFSRALQTGRMTTEELRTAREAIGDKWCRNLDGALLSVGVGVRSPAESDFRRLVLSSRVLPEPLWNQWVDLGDGGPLVCLDALWKGAGLVHEVNGRKYHAWGEAFDAMQARHDRLVIAGLAAMHNGATRIRRSGALVLAEVELAYARYDGRGMPAGVRLVQPPGNRA
jgi:hypothetical protein